jgi:hypothetical protein
MYRRVVQILEYFLGASKPRLVGDIFANKPGDTINI